MRMFKKWTKGDDELVAKVEPALQAPRVEDDIVYDEFGEVLYNPASHAEPSADIEEPATDFVPIESPLDAFEQDETDAEDDDVISACDDSFDETDSEHTPVADSTFDDEPAPFSLDTEQIGTSDLEVDVPETTATIEVEPVETPSPRPAQSPALLHKRVNLGELRMDVARITSDIQSGERLYQRAQQRVESLMGFVERAEVDFSLLNRLEPENRRLKARNRVLEAENDSHLHERRRIEKDLADAIETASEAKANLDTTKTRLAAATRQVEERDGEINRLTTELEQVGLKIERTQTSVEVESRENLILRDQITELSSRLDDVTSERMELAKIVESLKIDCDDFRAQKDQAGNEVSDLRVALATAQKVNGEMKSQMVRLHEEIRGFKTQYEFNVLSRDDRIIGLETRISDLTKQLAIKEDVAKSALADVTQLRKQRSSQDLERERLERIIETQQRQLDEAQAQIQRSSDSMAQLDKRYNDVSTALGVYQKRLSNAGEEVSERDFAEPLSPPPPFEAADQLPPLSAEEEALTPENVEEMIMDYKLGLRAQLG